MGKEKVYYNEEFSHDLKKQLRKVKRLIPQLEQELRTMMQPDFQRLCRDTEDLMPSAERLVNALLYVMVNDPYKE